MMNLGKLLEPETQKELQEILRQGNAERGAGWIRAFCKEYPFLSIMLNAALKESPAAAVISIAAFIPEIRLIPNVEKTIAEIQQRLRQPASR